MSAELIFVRSEYVELVILWTIGLAFRPLSLIELSKNNEVVWRFVSLLVRLTRLFKFNAYIAQELHDNMIYEVGISMRQYLWGCSESAEVFK